MCRTSWAHRRPHRSCSGHEFGYHHREHRHFGRGGGGGGGFGGADMSYPGGGDDGGAGAFGVRRPLRFLAHKLQLDDAQVAQLARILDELKTERAQAAVDDRRTLADFADALAGESFDAGKASVGADRRVEASRRLRERLVASLGQIHAILRPDQRERLAYLIRTGVLVV